MRRLCRRLEVPADGAGLAVFRILFGAVLLLSVVRFVARGWVDELLLAPSSHFTYFGFDWVGPGPEWAMYALFAAMGVFAACILVGLWTRLAAALFFLAFTYAELIEKASYLNHYYLVSLLALLLCAIPSSGVFSIAAARGAREHVPAWAYFLLRAQIALVYFYAGVAKLNSDWLVRGEPLATWLQAHAELPLVGPWLSTPNAALALSWAGAAYDLAIPVLLLAPRTRVMAFAAVVVFHVATWLLFPIGIFPWVMIATATVFFRPGWPRAALAWLRRKRGAPQHAVSATAMPVRPLSRPLALLLAAYLTLQVVLPVRHLLYPGEVNWTEQGFRFAWRVMLIEKTGQVDYDVFTSQPDGHYRVYPRRELTALQYKAMSTQPDMIHEFALRIADRFRSQGAGTVRVHANAWASLNGRPSQRLIDPRVDLAAVRRSLRPQAFIVPLAETAALRAGR